MPGAPEPVWSSAKKAIEKDRIIVRIPLQKGGGEIFFGKKINEGNLKVKFYRLVGTFDPINKNFTGYYETIDMNNFVYLKVDYINGIKVKEFRSRSMNVSNNNQSSVTTMGDSPPNFMGHG